jgi:hypothetical protein
MPGWVSIIENMIARWSAGIRGVAAALLMGACLEVWAAEPDANRTPILMELFTSEGCSSCPPVDKWAARLDQAQPIARGQLILLSEHVDYWDHDGWKDPFSSAQLTERQGEYSRAMGLSNVYTPQVIVDGDVEVRPWKADEAKASLEKAALAQTMAVKIVGVTVAGGELTGKVEADGTGGKHGDVFVAVAAEKTETDVLAGENHGKKLTNLAVVRSLVKIGKVEKGKAFSQDFKVKLWTGADAGNLRVVAFVQEPGPGKVLGAAMTREIGKGRN